MPKKSATTKPRRPPTLRRLPTPGSDEAAAAFVEGADLTRYDLSRMQSTRFEFSPKSARLNMRLPEELLAALKRAARRRGMPYQRFIRHTLEQALAGQR
jgi:predicted DNA binding CopG/RHH family protein